jgi:nucleoside-diphosphate-sugar epimerase
MENILSAAEKSGTVRRIVFTQAGAALVNTDDGNTLGTNMSQILNEHVKVNRTSAAFRPPLPSPHHAYCGAKAYCMTHLLSLRNSGQLPFSIIQVIPGTVIGPSEIVTTASQAYAQMDRMSKALLFNEPKPQYAFGFVHLNDCAAVHINSLDEVKVPESDVPDWFIAASTTPEGMEGKDVWREAGNVVERNFGKEVESGLFTVGRENMPVNMPYRVDSTLTERMLLEGAKFRSLGDCVREMGEWYRGLVEQEKGTQASTVQ